MKNVMISVSCDDFDEFPINFKSKLMNTYKDKWVITTVVSDVHIFSPHIQANTRESALLQLAKKGIFFPKKELKYDEIFKEDK